MTGAFHESLVVTQGRLVAPDMKKGRANRSRIHINRVMAHHACQWSSKEMSYGKKQMYREHKDNEVDE